MQRSCIILARSLPLRLSRCYSIAGQRDKCSYQMVAGQRSVHLRKYSTKVHQVVYDPKHDMTEEEVKHMRLDPVLQPPDPLLRGYALLLSFNGQGFWGMARNATQKSVEDHLHRAMLEAGLITEEEFLFPQLFSFQLSSRTDKGVSAVRLLTSGRFYCEKSEVKEKINQHLCDQVRVMAVFRTIKKFCCKNRCDSRTYSYTCPTFAFAFVTEITDESYRLSDDALEEIRGLFAEYKGFHNFHNFTSRIKPDEKQAIRGILDVECGEPFVRNGLEWITIKIKGYSFLLHQIRKMVGLVIAIRRGLASTDFISQALTKEYVNLPIAPGLGLMLEDQHYDHYNKKHASKETFLDLLVWDSVADEIEEFRQRMIMTPIMDTELRERSMLKWLSTQLLYYSFEMQESDRRSQISYPLVTFVKGVQLQIATGMTLEDAVTSLSERNNDEQDIDRTDGEEGIESSDDSEEETDNTDTKGISSNISNREGINGNINGKEGIESSFDHKKDIDCCTNNETDHSTDSKLSSESTDAKCNVSMGS